MKKQAIEVSVQTVVRRTAIYKPDFRFAVMAALAGFFLYAATISYSYVLDDDLVINQNRYVQEGIKGITGLFTKSSSNYQDIRLNDYYRPLSLITFAIEHQISADNPDLGHFDNVAFYALTGFFLCMLLMHIFTGMPPFFSLVISLLFITHPLHTEVVANIKSRDEILSFLLMITALYTSLLAYAAKTINLKLLAASCFLFYLALLSKETAVSAIFILPVLLFYCGYAGIKTIARYSVPFLLVLIIFQIQKFSIADHNPVFAVKDIVGYPYTETSTVIPSVFMLFLWSVKLIFVPYPLAYSYAYNQIPAADWSSPMAIGGLLLAASICYAILKYLPKKSILALGLMLSGLCILPVLGLIWLKGEMLAERFLYSSVLGFAIIIAAVIFRFAGNPQDTVNIRTLFSRQGAKFTLPFLLILGLYVTGTALRTSCWRNNDALFSHDVKVVPNSCQAHFHYGTELVEAGIASQDVEWRNSCLTSGKEQLFLALQIYPHMAGAFTTLGEANKKPGNNYDSAIYYYNRALQEGSDDPRCYLGLGQCYERLGKQELASYYYYTGARRYPNVTSGVMLYERHKKRTGLEVKVFPTESNVDSSENNGTEKGFAYYNQMGLAYGQKGDYANGARCLQKAVSLNPTAQQSYINLSNCLLGLKDYDGGISALNQVLQLNPANLQALSNLAVIYEHLGDAKNAKQYRDKISAIKK